MLGLRVQSTRLVRSVTTGLFQTHEVKLCNNRVMFLKSLIDKFHLTFKINLKWWKSDKLVEFSQGHFCQISWQFVKISPLPPNTRYIKAKEGHNFQSPFNCKKLLTSKTQGSHYGSQFSSVECEFAVVSPSYVKVVSQVILQRRSPSCQDGFSLRPGLQILHSVHHMSRGPVYHPIRSAGQMSRFCLLPSFHFQENLFVLVCSRYC